MTNVVLGDPSCGRVLVTGATGFVGRALVAAVPGLLIRAAVRRAPMSAGLPEHAIITNIDGQTDWSTALKDVDSVVHLAARAHVMKPSDEDRLDFERTNVEGTERLAHAAVSMGVKRFIYLSSIKVNGEYTTARGVHPDDPPHPQDGYAQSKREAERRLTAEAARGDMRVCIIRSPLVYGPGVRANFLRLLSWAYSGIPVPLASVVNARSMVNVWNLCDLICVLLRRPDPVNELLTVADGEDVSTADLVRRMARLMRRPERLFAVPEGFLRAAATLAGRGAELHRLCDSLIVDTTRTRTLLNWTPPVTLQEGLARTVNWYLRMRLES